MDLRFDNILVLFATQFSMRRIHSINIDDIQHKISSSFEILKYNNLSNPNIRQR